MNTSFAQLQDAEKELNAFLQSLNSRQVDLIKREHYKYVYSKRVKTPASVLDVFEGAHHVKLPEDFRYYLKDIGTKGIYYFNHASFLYCLKLADPTSAYESPIEAFLTTKFLELLVAEGFSVEEVEECSYDHITKTFENAKIGEIYRTQENKEYLLTFALILEQGGCGAFVYLVLNGLDAGKIVYDQGPTYNDRVIGDTEISVFGYIIQNENIFELLTHYVKYTIIGLNKIIGDSSIDESLNIKIDDIDLDQSTKKAPGFFRRLYDLFKT
ncbi:hypothetical protein [Mucilaginibacter sp.]|uniref:hypothetical protein n=1 Tax=Mucilaginibacter sp. TaxID=1882438 RepID=UPI003266B5CF